MNTNEKLATKGQINLKIAQASYEKPRNRPLHIFMFNIVNEYNEEWYCAYRFMDEVIIGFRGTVVSELHDLATDVFIAIGNEGKTTQFQKSLKLVKSIREKHPLWNLHLVGHSKGATQARYVGRELKIPYTAFNEGAGVSELVRQGKHLISESLGIGKVEDLGHRFKIKGDPVSKLASGSNVKEFDVGATGLASHSLSSFEKLI